MSERVLKDVRRRLGEAGVSLDERVYDVLREELGRERERLGLGRTVERERERRVEAETLRDVLEAINRQVQLEDTIAEVLRQLERLVVFDSCSLALIENGRCRILAARGFGNESELLGLTFENPLLELLRRTHWPIVLEDAQQDPRFSKLPGSPPIRSWAGVPLLVEGEVLGLLSLDRLRVDPFGEEDLQRARAVAFSAAAVIRNAQLLQQVRRYATLLEQVVALDQAVFAGRGPEELQQLVLQGALRLGSYPQGLLLLADGRKLQVAAGAPDLEGLVGRPAPPALRSRTVLRLTPDEVRALGARQPLPEQPLLVVPLLAGEAYVGCLALVDPNGESPDDRLMEAYAARVAAAWRHAVGGAGGRRVSRARRPAPRARARRARRRAP